MIPTYVISTPGDAKRLVSLVKELESQKLAMGSNITVFSAFMDHSMPRRGIARSHKAIVLDAKQKALPEILILEDDVHFLDEKSLEIFENIYRNLLPKDADIFMAGLYDGEIEKQYTGYAKVKGRISGLHCYIIKATFYDQIITADEDYNLDYYLSSVIHPNIYTAYPMLAMQNDGYSYNTKKEQTYNYNIEKKYKLYKNNGK